MHIKQKIKFRNHIADILKAYEEDLECQAPYLINQIWGTTDRLYEFSWEVQELIGNEYQTISTSS